MTRMFLALALAGLALAPGGAAAQLMHGCVAQNDRSVRCMTMNQLDGRASATAHIELRPTAMGAVVAGEVSATVGGCAWPGPTLTNPRPLGIQPFRGNARQEAAFPLDVASLGLRPHQSACVEFRIRNCLMATPGRDLPIECGMVISLTGANPYVQ